MSERTGRGPIPSISDNERGLNDIPFSVILGVLRHLYGINVNDLVSGLKLTGNKRKKENKKMNKAKDFLVQELPVNDINRIVCYFLVC